MNSIPSMSLKERIIRKYRRRSVGEIISQKLIELFILLVSILLLYPFLYMVSVSLSSYERVVDVVVFPKGFNILAYIKIFQMRSILNGYLNSFIYTGLSLIISLTLSILCAYPLSKSWLPFRRVLSIIVLITMYFGGGLIPVYLVVTKLLSFKNTIWAIVLPGALNTYYMILLRTYFVSSIPKGIDEAGRLDGANEVQILLLLFLPLSKPILATVSLYYFVNMWNSWFPASIYLDEQSMYPIQLLLRNSLSTNNIWLGGNGADDINYKSMDYALTIAVVLPIIFIYPFCQKYFIKGAMVGSLKE